jgi:DNA-directed RNA polymerase II subunit RPB1
MAHASHTVVEGYSLSIAGNTANRYDAVMSIENKDLLNHSTGQPVVGGSYDSRMGTFSHMFKCGTCGLGHLECPGHLGKIESPFPIENPAFISEIRKWLRAVCLKCGAPMVDLEALAETTSRGSRLKKAAESLKPGKPCAYCGEPHPKIVKDTEDYFTFYSEMPRPKGDTRPPARTVLYPNFIRDVFERVSDAAVEALGRPLTSAPRNLILTSLAAPPNTIRPSVRMGLGPTGSASMHETTNMLQHIVGAVHSLPGTIPAVLDPKTIKTWSILRQLYHSLIVGTSANANNSSSKKGRRVLMSGSQPVNSILRQLARKVGRYRKNIVGKRVWRISRSTISGNPQLKIDQVGLPVAFARAVSIKETVQAFNHARLLRFFLNGTSRYPGCIRVQKKSTGKIHNVGGSPAKGFRLEIGDVIFRNIITGDFCLFGRQPSLERSSIGAHEVVVLMDPTINTFQMNVLATPPYNADFDGDQMNMWFPWNAMARVEAELLCHLHNWFISTKNSNAIIGQIQDSVIGLFEFTRQDAVVDKKRAMRIFAQTRDTLPSFAGHGTKARFTGRELVSTLLKPVPITLRRKPTWYSPATSPYINYVPSETMVVIERGQMKSGVLDKATVGAGAPDGLFQHIASEHGSRVALKMAYSMQQMAIAFLDIRGFTVGATDMLITEEGQLNLRDIIDNVLRKSELISEKLIRGELVPPIGMTTHQYYEHLQKQALGTPDEALKPVMLSIDPNWNGLAKLVLTKSKGKLPNLMHIMSMIGQIEINTNRIQPRFGFARTCAYYCRFTLEPEAYGFIHNCYLSGMTMPETIWAAMHGRFDLINKALSTASTGYSNRKQVLCFQSDIVDNFLCMAKDNRIMQLLSGHDAFDTRRVQPVQLPIVFMDNKQLRHEYLLKVGKGGSQAVFDEAFRRVQEDRDHYRATQLVFENNDFADLMTDVRLVPANVGRLVRDAAVQREERSKAFKAAPPKVLTAMQEKVARFCQDLAYVYTNAEVEAADKKSGHTSLPQYLFTATTLLQMYTRAELTGPKLARLEPEELDWVLHSISHRVSDAIIAYGTAVGIIAAQAISEPLTQYMLDSHHRSVAGGTNKSGIVRPAEIFGAKSVKSERSPEMLLRVLPQYERDKAQVARIANQIELMTLGRFVFDMALLYEGFDHLVYPPYLGDKDWLAEYKRHHPLQKSPGDLTRWCVRFVLDKATMVLKSMSLEQIVEHLRLKHPAIYVVHTPENAPTIVIRVWFRTAWFKTRLDGDQIFKRVQVEILPTIARGIPRIRSARVEEVTRHFPGPDGALNAETVFAVRTVGTNLAGVMRNPQIDPLRAVSSSIDDTRRMYGIIAAEMAITREIRRFMGDSAPNERHLLLCAIEITLTGRLTSLELSGAKAREPQNVLMGAVFGDPTSRLTAAAVAGTKSRVHGPAPCLAVGRAPKLGSIYNNFLIDEPFVQANTVSVDQLLDAL